MTIRDCCSFFSGLGTGVGLALVLAPRSGAQMRSEIQGKVDEGRQVLRTKKDVALKTIEREKDGIAAAIDAGKQVYRETTGRGRSEATV